MNPWNEVQINRIPVSREARTPQRDELFAQSVVLLNERPDNLIRVTWKYAETFGIGDPIMNALVEDLAATFWQIRRLWAIQTTALNQKLSAKVDPIPLQSGEPEDDRLIEMSRTTAAYFENAATQPFRTLLRQDGELHRKYHRTLDKLIQLRDKTPTHRASYFLR